MQPAADFAHWWTISAVAATLAALVVLFFALVRDALRRPRGRRCPKCWYDMSGTDGRRCPECGRETKKEKHLFKARRNWRGALLGVFLLLIAAACGVTAKAHRDGWESVTPNTALLLIAQFSDDPWALQTLESRVFRNGSPFFLKDELWEWEWRWCGTVALRCTQPEHDVNLRLTAIHFLIVLGGLESVIENVDLFVNVCQSAAIDADPRIRQKVVFCLSNPLVPLDVSMHEMSRLLSDLNSDVRMSAASGMCLLARRDDRAVEKLLEAATDPDPDARARIVEVLSELAKAGGCNGPVAERVFQVFADDANELVRSAALRSIVRMNCPDGRAREIVVRLLDDQNDWMRSRAIAILPDVATDQEFLVQAAIKGLRDRSALVVLEAGRLIKRIDPKSFSSHSAELQLILNALETARAKSDAQTRAILDGPIENLKEILNWDGVSK